MKFTENFGYERFGKDFTFTYKDETSELAKKILASETTRNAVLESVCKALQGASAGSDNLNAFRPPETGKFNNFLPILFIFFICLARFSSIWSERVDGFVLRIYESLFFSLNKNIGMLSL